MLSLICSLEILKITWFPLRISVWSNLTYSRALDLHQCLDLVWHTHQLKGGQYEFVLCRRYTLITRLIPCRKEIIDLTGRFVDHNDKVEVRLGRGAVLSALIQCLTILGGCSV